MHGFFLKHIFSPVMICSSKPIIGTPDKIWIKSDHFSWHGNKVIMSSKCNKHNNKMSYTKTVRIKSKTWKRSEDSGDGGSDNAAGREEEGGIEASSSVLLPVAQLLWWWCPQPGQHSSPGFKKVSLECKPGTKCSCNWLWDVDYSFTARCAVSSYSLPWCVCGAESEATPV